VESSQTHDLIYRVKQNITGAWYVMEVNYTIPTAYFDKFVDARIFARYLLALNTGSKLEIHARPVTDKTQKNAHP
jgi:hypothetical protein